MSIEIKPLVKRYDDTRVAECARQTGGVFERDAMLGPRLHIDPPLSMNGENQRRS